MEKDFLKHLARAMGHEKNKTVRKAGLSSIGEDENSLYYAMKHRERSIFAAFNENYEIIKGALVEHDGDFFSLKVYGAGRAYDGRLMLNKLAEAAVYLEAGYEEIMTMLREADCLSLGELLVFPAFLRRSYLKSFAQIALILRRGGKASAELDKRINSLSKGLSEIGKGEEYARTSAAYGMLMDIRGFRTYDDESRQRCLSAFGEISAKSGLGDERCAEVLGELCGEATADVFLLGRRREMLEERIGIKRRYIPSPLTVLRLVLVILPTATGALIGSLFETDFARPLYAVLLTMCAYIPISSYFTDVLCGWIGDRRPCAAKNCEKRGDIDLPKDCFIEEEGIDRLNGISNLYNSRRVLTERRIFISGEGGLLPMILESDDENRLFYAFLGINLGDCGLVSEEGEGDIFDSHPTIFIKPAKDLSEHLKREYERIRMGLMRPAETRGEGLMKLSHIFSSCYPICALMLLYLSCLQQTVGEMLLMQLCAVVPPVISGWMGFSRRIDTALKRKGSAIRIEDIRRILRRELFSSVFRMLLLPCYGDVFLRAATGVSPPKRKGEGIASHICALKPCMIFAVVFFIFSIAARGGVTLNGSLWTAVYLISPFIIWAAERV